ncbi:MAG: PIN domain-containing protein [Bacilli bacterium]|nr:PIN domain-containing protein [Bacilli bacterium]
MKILVDTNIFLDIYLKRNAFLDDSVNALKYAFLRFDSIFFSCSCLTDFYYNMAKGTHDKDYAKMCTIDVVKHIKLANVDDLCVYSALASNIKDFEDAVVDAVAVSIGADYILTRNKKDFEHSKVKAITPKEFLSL